MRSRTTPIALIVLGSVWCGLGAVIWMIGAFGTPETGGPAASQPLVRGVGTSLRATTAGLITSAIGLALLTGGIVWLAATSGSSLPPRSESQTDSRRSTVGRGAETQPDPFAVLIDHLAQDGLTDEAARLNVILRQTAWTTGTEFLGAFGLEMKSMRRSVRRRASVETQVAFRSAAKVVKKCWPRMFWP